MEELGIMLYGYEKTDAYVIKKAIESILSSSITLLSGSLKESHIIEDILSDEMYDTYDDRELKVLMFLGFDDGQINLVLDNFPRTDQITRPIFCGLTENNLKWPLNRLLEHLVEEEKYWKSRDSKQDKP